MAKCKGITKSGTQCKNNAIVGSEFCSLHQPQKVKLFSLLLRLIERHIWPVFGVVASIIGFINDLIAFITGFERILLWGTVSVLILATWFSNLYILYASPQTINPQQLKTARRWVWGIPAWLLIVFFAYYILITIPSKSITVLIADFVDPSQVDNALVTQVLTQKINEALDGYKGIKVVRLNYPIQSDNGHQIARNIGMRLWYKATIVIWGNYTLNPDPEIYVNFDLIQSTANDGFYKAYGPTQIKQPDMFNFKFKLGEHLGQMVAFAAGIILYKSNRYIDAVPFFDKATEAIGSPFVSDLERYIHYYRGSNYLVLGRTNSAKSDLMDVVVELDNPSVVPDEFSANSLNNLGLAFLAEGNYDLAKKHLEHAYQIFKDIGSPFNQAQTLANLGLLATKQSDYDHAKKYLDEALNISTKFGIPNTEAQSLGNLGVLAFLQMNYPLSKQYSVRSLEISEKINYLDGQGQMYSNLANIAFIEKDYVNAQKYYDQALEIFKNMNNLLGEAEVLANLGNVASESQNDYLLAKTYYEKSLAIFTDVGNTIGKAQTQGNLGLLEFAHNNRVAALNHLEQSKKFYQEISMPIPNVIEGTWQELSLP